MKSKLSKCDVRSLKQKIQRFYEEDPSRVDLLRSFLGDNPPLALRHLDFFCVTYSKKADVHYLITDRRGETRPFYVHGQYKAQLKMFSKGWFDPFRRQKKKVFNGDIKTNWAQMNFFRWAMSDETMVLAYAKNNVDRITRAYKDFLCEKSLARKANLRHQGDSYLKCSAGRIYHFREKLLIRFPTSELLERTYLPAESHIVCDAAAEKEGQPEWQKGLGLTRSECFEVPLAVKH